MSSTEQPGVPETLQSAREIWGALASRGGLTIATTRRSGYDDDLLAELSQSLFGDAKGSLDDLLDTHGVTSVQLLDALFRAIAPFAGMMTDILVMFEAAGARRSDGNLRIAIEFDAVLGGLEFNLESFRETVRHFEQMTGMVRRRRWSLDNAWSIWSLYTKSPLARGSYEIRIPESDRADIPAPEIAAWLDDMRPGHRFPLVPPPLSSGVVAYDALQASIWMDMQDFQRLARGKIGAYANIHAQPRESTNVPGWDWALFREATHDLWPAQVIRPLVALANALRNNPYDEDALKLQHLIEAETDKFTSPPEPAEVLREAIEDILSLPVWQRRHELYSVWIAAVIIRRLSAHPTEILAPGGRLSFPFAPTHLATFGPPDALLELWSEVRTPAGPNPIGRVSAVQPDYRLRKRNAATDEHTDLLIIECKQYRRASSRNFSAALSDYASACPDAQVRLVNYGPVTASVMTRVKAGVSDRCDAYGLVRPSGAGREQLEDAIGAIAAKHLPADYMPVWSQGEIRVELHWREPVDLDLHVRSKFGQCGFDAIDGLAEAQFQNDDRGTEPGWHKETILLRPNVSDDFDIIIVAFSGVDQVSDAPSAELRIYWQSEGEQQVEFYMPNGANSRRWHAMSLRRGQKEPIIVDRPA